MPNRELAPLDPSTLDAVTGGATRKVGSTNTQMTTALQSITSTLDDLKRSQTKQGSSLTQLLPMVMMAKWARRNA